jgi:hypothetical protein
MELPSEEAVEAFRNALGTITQEVGIEEPLQFFLPHTATSVPIGPGDRAVQP